MDPQPTEREQRVTPLELFFDLVVVFAITQVTQFMSHDLSWRGIGHGLLVLAAIWWAWTGYAWLTNALEPEEGQVRAGMFGAMATRLQCVTRSSGRGPTSGSAILDAEEITPASLADRY
jgi:low temperature requirement protein LtrA